MRTDALQDVILNVAVGALLAGHAEAANWPACVFEDGGGRSEG